MREVRCTIKGRARQRTKSPIRKGEEGGARIEAVHPLNDQELIRLRSDRLRLFPYILWKSCTCFGAKSRRFDESSKKSQADAVEKCSQSEIGALELERSKCFQN